MDVYGSSQMVKKEHAKIIAEQLRELRSKVPESINLDGSSALANLLSLACGGGKYRLEIIDIMGIGNSEFSIDKGGVETLCRNSTTRSPKPINR